MGAGAAVGAIVGLVSAWSAHKTGKRQEALAKEALASQQAQERKAASSAVSQRMAQALKRRALLKKRPKEGAALAAARAASKQGLASTFLTPFGPTDPVA